MMNSMAKSTEALKSPHPQAFVEEINPNDLHILEAVGRGSFGTVYKAEWRGIHVAVKCIEDESESNAFAVEVRQLSRVSHPNIIILYGTCTKSRFFSLVMEYAEGGSLYNLLHTNRRPYYSAAHAMSWAKQCAEGVAYLHAMRPKPLIHRDLKPPNLLLVDFGRKLKICDFGTVADKSSIMTNNKGSAAWMAPEVFRGQTYTEKCDVFSWGIILWQVLAREQPFKDSDTALGIMWSVHNGNRPPLIEGCPKPIERLITSCWDANPSNRPAMDYVVNLMRVLCQFFPGEDEPLDYYKNPPDDSYDAYSDDVTDINEDWDETHNLTSSRDSQPDFLTNIFTANRSVTNRQHSGSSISKTFKGDTISEQGEIHWASPDDPSSESSALTSSFAEQRNEIIRNGILNSQNLTMEPLSLEVDPDAWALKSVNCTYETIIKTIPKSQGNDTSTVSGSISTQADDSISSSSLATTTSSTTIASEDDPDTSDSSLDLDTMHLMLDPELQPPAPDPNSRLSQEIFEEHKNLAKEYLKIQTEIAFATKLKNEILASLSKDQKEERLRRCKQLEEKEDLLELHSYLKRQLDRIKPAQGMNPGDQQQQLQRQNTQSLHPHGSQAARIT